MCHVTDGADSNLEADKKGRLWENRPLILAESVDESSVSEWKFDGRNSRTPNSVVVNRGLYRGLQNKDTIDSRLAKRRYLTEHLYIANGRLYIFVMHKFGIKSVFFSSLLLLKQTASMKEKKITPTLPGLEPLTSRN